MYIPHYSTVQKICALFSHNVLTKCNGVGILLNSVIKVNDNNVIILQLIYMLSPIRILAACMCAYLHVCMCIFSFMQFPPSLSYTIALLLLLFYSLPLYYISYTLSNLFLLCQFLASNFSTFSLLL